VRQIYWFVVVCFCAFSLLACSPPIEATLALSQVEEAGKMLFTTHCAACHTTVPGTVIVGPSLAGVATRAGTRVAGQDAPTYLQTSLLAPGAFIVDGFPESMPPDFGKRLSGEEFDAIVAYLLTLK